MWGMRPGRQGRCMAQPCPGRKMTYLRCRNSARSTSSRQDDLRLLFRLSRVQEPREFQLDVIEDGVVGPLPRLRERHECLRVCTTVYYVYAVVLYTTLLHTDLTRMKLDAH